MKKARSTTTHLTRALLRPGVACHSILGSLEMLAQSKPIIVTYGQTGSASDLTSSRKSVSGFCFSTPESSLIWVSVHVDHSAYSSQLRIFVSFRTWLIWAVSFRGKSKLKFCPTCSVSHEIFDQFTEKRSFFFSFSFSAFSPAYIWVKF